MKLMEDYSVVISKTNSQSTAFLRILDNDIYVDYEKRILSFIYITRTRCKACREMKIVGLFYQISYVFSL